MHGFLDVRARQGGGWGTRGQVSVPAGWTAMLPKPCRRPASRPLPAGARAASATAPRAASNCIATTSPAPELAATTTPCAGGGCGVLLGFSLGESAALGKASSAWLAWVLRKGTSAGRRSGEYGLPGCWLGYSPRPAGAPSPPGRAWLLEPYCEPSSPGSLSLPSLW